MIVVAAVLIENQRVLFTQRKQKAHLGGMWEFPGGKVGAIEDPRKALKREMSEELGIAIDVGDILDVTFYHYEDIESPLLLLFFEVYRLPHSPEPQALDVVAFRWSPWTELIPSHFPPADSQVLDKVRERLKQEQNQTVSASLTE
ncbi:(deoxy)nucleoside triphosphate pyrophosphohydrolase [Pajaroellobacter abortibovis]|nr:(deoxy)nucleoside triphosphate pyrophosphohydrolase [Pajaroellobacter abortibovis]